MRRAGRRKRLGQDHAAEDCGACWCGPRAGACDFSKPGAAQSSRRSLLRVKRRIGMVAHHILLYDELTAEENLDALRQALWPRSPRGTRRRRARTGGPGFAPRAIRVRNFSRGMRQRLAIARALLAGPGFCCSTNLPPASIPRASTGWARRWRGYADDGCTILMSTHGRERSARRGHARGAPGGRPRRGRFRAVRRSAAHAGGGARRASREAEWLSPAPPRSCWARNCRPSSARANC